MRNKLVFGALLALNTLDAGIAGATEVSSLYRSTRSLGRGNTGVATNVEEDALFYNPANLAARDKGGTLRRIVVLSPAADFSTHAPSTSKAFQGSDDDQLQALKDLVGTPAHVGVYNFTGAIFSNGAAGVLASSNNNVLIYKDPEQSGIETLDMRSYTDTGVVGGFAMPLGGGPLSAGAGIKLLQRQQLKVVSNLSDVSAIERLKSGESRSVGTGIGADLGLELAPQVAARPQLGVSLLNVGDTSFDRSDSAKPKIDALPQTLNVGIAVSPDLGKTLGVSLQLDYADALSRGEDNVFKKIHAGTELSLGGYIGLLLGINQGYPTMGIALDVWYLRLDLGSYAEEVGDRVGERPDRRYFVKLALGF